MKTGGVLSLLFAAAVIAFSVRHVIEPRLDPAKAEPDTAGIATVNVATPAPAPPQTEETEPSGTAILKRESDGHYWGLANVDGYFVKVMVDTGASTVALTYEDAKALRLNPDRLDYSYRIRTAGGEVMGAAVKLRKVRIGSVVVHDVNAMVLKDGLQQSLLGMSFLGELSSYEFRRDNLILRR